MLIALQSFAGERPAVDARQLGLSEATLAENAKIWTGVLDTWRAPSLEYSETVDEDVVSIYRYQAPDDAEVTWMLWDTDVDVVKSQVAGLDELYWTGDGAPKIGNQTSIEAGSPYAAFDLGTPAPAAAVVAEGQAVAEVPTGDVLAITSVPAGGLIEFVTTPAPPGVFTENNTYFDDDLTFDPGVSGLLNFSIRATMGGNQAHGGQNSYFTVHVEIDPASSAENSGVTIFTKTVQRGVPYGSFSWSTFLEAAGAYDFQYAPPPGSHTYRLWLGHTVKKNDGLPTQGYSYQGSMTVNTPTNDLLVQLDTASHGISVGDRVQFSGIVGTGTLGDLNAAPVEVIAVSGDTITVSAPGVSGVYDDTPPGTWTPVWETEQLQVRTYVYTYVATLGSHDMESAPSAPSNFVNSGDGQPVVLTGFTEPPSDGRPYSKIRIYRLAVGDEAEEFLFVDELDVDTFDFDMANTYTDTVRGIDLGIVLPSQYTSPIGQLIRWEVPPAGMSGIIELPNGMYAAFLGNELLLCEPYQPHAWPLAYRRAMKDEIVAIGAFGSSILVATKGRPVIVTGTDPGAMSDEYVEAAYPCLSKRSLIDIGYAVVYATLRGLVMISQGQATIITKRLFTDNQWAALNPSTIVAGKYGSRYVWSYDPDTAALDLPINKKALILDAESDTGTLTRLSLGPTEYWADPSTDELYVVANIAAAGAIEPTLGVYKWEGDPANIFGAIRWRSREFTAAVPTFVGVIKVDADLYPVTVTLYMDGAVYDTIVVVSDDFHRVNTQLGKGRKWQIEVESITGVEAIYAAANAREIRQYIGNT